MKERLLAIVTGGSAGIGAEICRQMLDAGYRVVALSRRKPDWTHERLESLQVDLLDPEATRQAAQTIAERYEPTHVVHNAGIIRPNLLPDVTPEDIAVLTQLHITAPVILTQAVLPAMRAARFGRIIFVTSRAALGVPTRTAYSATKAGIHGMARTWALELGPEGITVNVVAPGPILTDNFWGIIPKGSEREEKLAQSLPVRRLGKVEDVARAVMFFAAPEADFVTGQTLFVCGGASIGSLSL